MRRIDLLINEARQETDNTAFTDETGLQQSEFLRWANSAQTRILSLIQQEHPDLFQQQTIFNGVQGQESYPIPPKTFLTTRLQMVEYSRTGQDRDYYQLKKGWLSERVNGPMGTPAFYIRFSTNILIQPQPDTNGKIRVVTQLALPRLDLRRAVVQSSILDTVTNTITNLTLDPNVSIDAQDMIDEGYICINDKDGNILMEGIPVSDVNITTGIVTVYPGFTFQAGETIPAGSFVTLGQYSTTNSMLPDVAERYLVDFMCWKAEKRDANQSSIEMSQEIKDQEMDIVSSYGVPGDDVDYVAVLDAQFLDTDYTRW